MTPASPSSAGPEPGHSTSAAAVLPPNPRIVVVSTGFDPGYDGVADELARRLHDRGWWVDRPNLTVSPRFASRRPMLRASSAGSTVEGVLADRIVDTALTRPASRLVARLGESPHAVVSVHPLVDRVVSMLRDSGELTAPVASYLAGPAVGTVREPGQADVILSPHPTVDRMLRSSPCSSRVVPIRVDSGGACRPAPSRPSTDRARVVVPAWSSGSRRIAEVVRDLASWGVWPLVVCGTNHAVARRVDALGVGTRQVGAHGATDSLRDADFVVDPTGGHAGWTGLLHGRQLICYNIPRSTEGLAADLHTAGAAVWARDRIDLGLAVTGAIASASPSSTTRRLDPVPVIEALARGDVAPRARR